MVERIAANGFSDLIRDTRSCAHVHDMTSSTRIAACARSASTAASRSSPPAWSRDDPAEAYKVDLFTGERSPGPGRELALAYVRSASDIASMTEVGFFSHYGEASRAVGFFEEPAGTVAKRIFDLHRRHAAAVCRVFDQATSAHAAALREGTSATDRACSPSSWASAKGRMRIRSELPRSSSRSRPARRSEWRSIEKRVVFDRWGEITGVGAELLIALAKPFRKAMIEELAPENFPFIKTADLLRRLNCNGETLRRRVYRCRNEIARLATGAGDAPPAIDAVIENSQWHGYRLNPDSDPDRGDHGADTTQVGHGFRWECHTSSTASQQNQRLARRDASRLSAMPSTDFDAQNSHVLHAIERSTALLRARAKERAAECRTWTRTSWQNVGDKSPRTLQGWRQQGKGPRYLKIGSSRPLPPRRRSRRTRPPVSTPTRTARSSTTASLGASMTLKLAGSLGDQKVAGGRNARRSGPSQPRPPPAAPQPPGAARAGKRAADDPENIEPVSAHRQRRCARLTSIAATPFHDEGS